MVKKGTLSYSLLDLQAELNKAATKFTLQDLVKKYDVVVNDLTAFVDDLKDGSAD